MTAGRDNDEPPPLIDNDDEIEDDDENVEEPETTFSEDSCKDLFSETTFPSVQACLDHCNTVHKFDIQVNT